MKTHDLRVSTCARASGRQNVLCIDAEDDSRLLIAEVLYEHEVDFALTADDAVQLAHCRSYSLCFLDPQVPGFGHTDVIREFTVFNAHAALVICTTVEWSPPETTLRWVVLRKPLSGFTVRETAVRLLTSDA